MKEHGILYSAPMVLAHLADRKRQTRRAEALKVINVDPENWTIEQQGLISAPGHKHSGKFGVLLRHVDGRLVCVPFQYAPGDHLWVREAWRTAVAVDDCDSPAMQLRLAIAGKNPADVIPIQYEADKGRRNWIEGLEPGRYRHARFMPRWASRIDREVTAIRCERLHDITAEDAIAEGIERRDLHSAGRIVPFFRDYSNPDGSDVHSLILACPIESYRTLWDSINGAGAWDLNPWLFVTTFKRIEQ